MRRFSLNTKQALPSSNIEYAMFRHKVPYPEPILENLYLELR